MGFAAVWALHKVPCDGTCRQWLFACGHRQAIDQPSTTIESHREPSRAAQSHWQRRDRGSGLAGHVRSNAADGRPTHGLPPTHASPSAAEGRSRIGAILVFGVSWLEIRSPGAPSRPHPTLSLCLSVSSHLPIGALAHRPQGFFWYLSDFLLHRTATSRAWMRPGFAKANSTRGSAHNRRCVPE